LHNTDPTDSLAVHFDRPDGGRPLLCDVREELAPMRFGLRIWETIAQLHPHLAVVRMPH
jgi:hypothetical protein